MDNLTQWLRSHGGTARTGRSPAARTNNQMRGQASASWVDWVKKGPVMFTYFLVIGTYIPVVYLLFIEFIWWKMGNHWRFAFDLVVYHALFLLTLYSLYLASTLDTGSPHPLYRRLLLQKIKEERKVTGQATLLTHSGENAFGTDEEEAAFRGITVDEWRQQKPTPPRYESLDRHRNHVDDDDVPLRGLTSITSHGNSYAFAAPPTSLGRQWFTDHSTRNPNVEGIAEDDELRASLLAGPQVPLEEEEALDLQTDVMPKIAKGATGAIRWCRKCDVPKPDRCHHCSQCGKCVLKMDHHCVWLGNCVGYRNQKPFLLFLLYSTLLALFSGKEAAYVTYYYFTTEEGMEEVIDFRPIAYIQLCMLGAIFGLCIGGFLLFHLYLISVNMTQLERMDPDIPAARLPSDSLAEIEPTEPRRPRLDVPRSRGWKPDHVLSRDERRYARNISKELNIYDVGTKRNFSQVFDPKGRAPVWTWLWPGTRTPEAPLAGHTFDHNTRHLGELQNLTAKLRLGKKLINSSQSKRVQYDKLTLQYGHDPLQQVDVYLPQDIPITDVLVFIHGGAWRSGDKSDHTDVPDHVIHCSRATGKVPAVIIPNYRLSHAPDHPERYQAAHPEHILDVVDAINHAFSMPELRSSQRCYMMGHSCGAHILSHIATGLSILDIGAESARTQSLSTVLQRTQGFGFLDGIYDLTDLIEEYPDYGFFVKAAFGDALLWDQACVNRQDKSTLPTHSRSVVAHSREDELLTTRQSILWHQWLISHRASALYDETTLSGKHDDCLHNSGMADLISRILSQS